MTKSTVMEVQRNPKTWQNLNLKDIGQHFIVQTIIHQFQGFLQKGKESRIWLIVLKTGICQGCHIAGIRHDEQVLIDLMVGDYILIVLNIAKAIIIDFH